MLGNGKRLELLRRARARQRSRDACLTAAERLAIARRLHRLSVAAGTWCRCTRGDEPAAVWLSLVARLRQPPPADLAGEER